eukprot:CAMPEP_0178925996 /NCGR_PEP_ID=MMETSP0786-20121207/18254_1 /TAXON_ID=186022 /ORGANISM="Thalassionema frauenfeldii, Strain CCMP 1798" /LENGTH=163 /DNA_ID=CAMNT_0020601003 /DNA_START=493 /DNA_END=981 /DNA_ORIENTATION=+
MKSLQFSAPMIQVILAGITAWLNNELPEFPNATNTPGLSIPNSAPILRILQQAYHAQSQIGWDSFLFGHLNTLWFTAHDKWCDLPDLKSTQYSNNVAPRLIKYILLATFQVWQKRNKFYHGATIEENINLCTQDADASIKAHYSSKTKLTDSDASLPFALNLQ